MTFGSTTAEQVDLVDLEDAVQPLHREHDAAVRRHRAAGVAGAGAAHDERHAVLVAEPRDGGHLRRVGRADHEVGRWPLPRASAA